MSFLKRKTDNRMAANVTIHVTSRQSQNVTFPVIPQCNSICNNYGMKNTLADVRKKLKLNQDDFAEIIGKSRVHLSRMENNEHPLSFKLLSDIIEKVNAHFGAGTIGIRDFYATDEDADIMVAENEQEKAFLTLIRQMGDKDQDRFLSMATAYIGQNMPPVKSKKS